MFQRSVWVLMIVWIVGTVSATATAFEPIEQLRDGMRHRAKRRSQIRAQPLLERPYRMGHVYGNNVRRVHRWRHR